MRIETDGLVIREQTVGESDRLVTLLTRSAGILRGFARQAKTIRSAKASGTSLLCYSQFSVFKGRERVIIDDARPKESFFGLREDISRLALAQYFCELAGVLDYSGQEALDASLDSAERAFRAAVQRGMEQRLRGEPPRTGTSDPGAAFLARVRAAAGLEK